ncbi:MAG: hypothetical protein Rubg2KO_35120 [Rubricoccaceae bacterium]
MKIPLTFVLAALLAVTLSACGGKDASDTSSTESASSEAAAPASDLPIAEALDLGPVDATLAAQGEEIYTTRCTTCHKMDERYIGPALSGLMDRRSPEWVMNMILAPEKMIASDPEAQALLAEYNVPMTNQNLTQDEARAVLEYLRQLHEGA